MTRAEMTDRELEELADRAAPLDALLVDAALGPMRRLAPNSSTVRFAARLARHPMAPGRRQGYLAASRTAEALVDDAGLDWRDDRRVRFLADNLIEALSPSNIPLVNPASAKA